MRFFLIFLLFATPSWAQDSRLLSLQTGHASKGWEAVGRLDISGKGFCTAALISDQMILTAAHCLFDDTGEPISTDRFVFEAGLRNGRAEASRGITKALAHPGYQHLGSNRNTAEIATDIAPWCRAQQISLCVYWPLMKGLLAGKLPRTHVFDPNDGRAKYPMFQGDEWQKNQDFLDDLKLVAAK